METRTFGRTGLEVSVLGFGGAPIGVLETGQAEVDGVLGLLLDHGVNLVDTAAGYRGSEEAIGRSIGSRRDDFVLVSKCGQAFDDLPGEPWSEELISSTIERSLARLQTDYLDVMLLHTCDLEVLERGEAVGALVRAREAGKIRFAGYSGDNQAGAYAARLDDVAVIQTSINICDQVNIDCVLPVAAECGVAVMAKRPIANAAWKDLNDQPGFYARYAETYTERLALMAIGPEDIGFEESDWAELALRFTLSCDLGTAIIGTTNPDHVLANIEAASRGPLPEEAVAKLREAFVAAMALAGEEWTGQT
jgi:aryl-alcohol dehydrogenase-like predicted oxidoreductase